MQEVQAVSTPLPSNEGRDTITMVTGMTILLTRFNTFTF